MSSNSVRIICRSSDILDHTMNPISRRNMLAGLMGTTVAVGLPLAAATAEPQIKERPDAKPKLKVVVTGGHPGDPEYGLSLIHISEPTRLGMISYAVFCLKK